MNGTVEGVNINQFIWFYHNADEIIRRYFVRAVALAAEGVTEWKLKDRMETEIKKAEIQFSVDKINHRQMKELLQLCSRMDEFVALELLNQSMRRLSGVSDRDEDESIPILDTAQMVNQPPVTWLVEKLLPEDSFSLIAGEYGAGKSFIMLDVAFHVALGIPWHGNKVAQGPVVFLASEGSRGLQKRMEAWMIKHELDIDESIPLYTIPQAIDLTNPRIFSQFMQVIPQGTKLVIIDTLHTFMEGDENSAQDVKPMLDMIRQLNRNGIAVAVVHHLNKSGSIRGSNSIPAGADAVFEVKRDENDKRRIQLHCTKQKDFDKDECAAMFFRMEKVSLETEYGTSVVLGLETNATKRKDDAIPMTPKFKEVLKYIYSNPGANRNQIIDGTGVSKNTWTRARERLLEMNLIKEKVRGQYYPVPKK